MPIASLDHLTLFELTPTGTGGGRKRFRVHPRRTAAPSGGAARRASASDARRFTDAAGNAGADAGHRSGCPRLRRIQAETGRRPGGVRAGAGVRRGTGSTGGGGQRGRAGSAGARRSAARTLRARAPVRRPDEPRADALDRDSDHRRGAGCHRGMRTPGCPIDDRYDPCRPFRRNARRSRRGAARADRLHPGLRCRRAAPGRFRNDDLPGAQRAGLSRRRKPRPGRHALCASEWGSA